MMWTGFGTMWFLGPLTMVVFWGAVILLVIWAARSFSARPTGPSSDSADDVLKRRLASGEITQEQYEQTRKVLHG